MRWEVESSQMNVGAGEVVCVQERWVLWAWIEGAAESPASFDFAKAWGLKYLCNLGSMCQCNARVYEEHLDSIIFTASPH